MKANKNISILVVAILALAMTTMTSPQPQAQSESPTPPDEVKTLLIEKRDVLKQRFTLINDIYQGGNRRYELTHVLDAELDLLNAELALTTTKADRIKILERKVENRRTLEEQQKQLISLEPNLAAPIHLMTKAERLDAQIELTREKSLP